MPNNVMLNLRLPSALAKRLATVATATDRTRTYVAARAVEEYVESEEETLTKIREGLVQADVGETVSHAEAQVFLDRIKVRGRRGPNK